jgi:hypothetical protein
LSTWDSLSGDGVVRDRSEVSGGVALALDDSNGEARDESKGGEGANCVLKGGG